MGTLWEDGNVLFLTVVVVTWVHTFIKTHWYLHFKWEHFTIENLCLNRLGFENTCAIIYLLFIEQVI